MSADCFRWYDLPIGRTWESFRYLIEEYDGEVGAKAPTDSLVTDQQAEVARIAAAMADQGYCVRITEQATGKTAMVEP